MSVTSEEAATISRVSVASIAAFTGERGKTDANPLLDKIHSSYSL
jgi:hypothetical protein